MCSRHRISIHIPDSKVHGANMGPTWVLSAPDGPHVGPMNLAIRDSIADPSHCICQQRMYNLVKTHLYSLRSVDFQTCHVNINSISIDFMSLHHNHEKLKLIQIMGSHEVGDKSLSKPVPHKNWLWDILKYIISPSSPMCHFAQGPLLLTWINSIMKK